MVAVLSALLPDEHGALAPPLHLLSYVGTKALTHLLLHLSPCSISSGCVLDWAEEHSQSQDLSIPHHPILPCCRQ